DYIRTADVRREVGFLDRRAQRATTSGGGTHAIEYGVRRVGDRVNSEGSCQCTARRSHDLQGACSERQNYPRQHPSEPVHTYPPPSNPSPSSRRPMLVPLCGTRSGEGSRIKRCWFVHAAYEVPLHRIGNAVNTETTRGWKIHLSGDRFVRRTTMSPA